MARGCPPLQNKRVSGHCRDTPKLGPVTENAQQQPTAPSTELPTQYAPGLMLGVFGIQVLLAFTITAFGVAMSVRVKQMQSFMALNQLLIMPLYFMSGAMFPASNLPVWLTALNRIDPLSYAVDPIRRLVFAHLDLTPAVRARLAPGLTWGGWHVPIAVEVAVLAVLGLALLATAIAQFGRAD